MILKLKNSRMLTQAAGVCAVFLVVALLVGPQGIVAIDVMAALLLGAILYRLIAPVALALATIGIMAAGFLFALLQAGGLTVQQPARATLPFGSVGRMEPQSTFSLFGLAPDQLVNATFMVAFQALCVLLILQTVEWWQEGRAASALQLGLPIEGTPMYDLRLRVLLSFFVAALFLTWSGSVAQGLLVGIVLGVSVAGIVDAQLFTIAGVAQIVCCVLLLMFERSGLLAQSQDIVAFLAAHGITTFEPLCSTVGVYAGVLLLAGALGHRAGMPGETGRQVVVHEGV